MLDRPARLPMFTHDLMQATGFDDPANWVPQRGTAHNALEDARWHRAMWRHLHGYSDASLWDPIPVERGTLSIPPHRTTIKPEDLA